MQCKTISKWLMLKKKLQPNSEVIYLMYIMYLSQEKIADVSQRTELLPKKGEARYSNK